MDLVKQNYANETKQSKQEARTWTLYWLKTIWTESRSGRHDSCKKNRWPDNQPHAINKNVQS
jgi:hypothetical protein